MAANQTALFALVFAMLVALSCCTELEDLSEPQQKQALASLLATIRHDSKLHNVPFNLARYLFYKANEQLQRPYNDDRKRSHESESAAFDTLSGYFGKRSVPNLLMEGERV